MTRQENSVLASFTLAFSVSRLLTRRLRILFLRLCYACSQRVDRIRLVSCSFHLILSLVANISTYSGPYELHYCNQRCHLDWRSTVLLPLCQEVVYRTKVNCCLDLVPHDGTCYGMVTYTDIVFLHSIYQSLTVAYRNESIVTVIFYSSHSTTL